MTPEDVHEQLQKLRTEVLTKREFESWQAEKRLEKLKAEGVLYSRVGIYTGIALYAGMIGVFIGSCVHH